MKSVSWILLAVLTVELVQPVTALALTTGPSQPEVQSFEPVGTTDMVDMFSGDFVYNIPLMDVEGYPINIAYHGGVSMEQEASWVGLGWNINPGEINHVVRGVPDDFNGDTVYKELHIKDDITTRVGTGVGVEILGTGDPKKNPGSITTISVNTGVFLNFNNYRGVSCDFAIGAGINLLGIVSPGINIGVGSQSGFDFDYNVNLSLKASQINNDVQTMDYSAGIGVNQGMNSRSGLKDFNFSAYAGAGYNLKQTVSAGENKKRQQLGIGSSYSGAIPVSFRNFVPVITNSTTMTSIFGRLKFGFEESFFYPYAKLSGMYNVVHFNNDASRKSFGYLYLEKSENGAKNMAVLDFTRDKDGLFNKHMKYIPPANIAYDIYNVSGQGTYGTFRPYRNDFGSVFDPYTLSYSESNSLELEAGIHPNIFEVGGDFSVSKTDISSHSWDTYDRTYRKRNNNSIYENVYLKQGGELTSGDDSYFPLIKESIPMTPDEATGLPQIRDNSDNRREPRGNLVYYFTGAEMSKPGIGGNPYIMSYTTTNGFASGAEPAMDTVKRVETTPLGRKKDQLSQVVQLQKDGRRYVYGLPVINHIQKEATFSVQQPTTDGNTTSDGLVSFTVGTDDAVANGNGVDNYFSSSVIPSYVHSYLLTSVLSTDYVDVTGDGISDDDLGGYTKFNYSLKQNDYRWRAPYLSNKAQHNPGFRSDPRDDKGSYTTGSREEWMLHSVETRNFVAEFYTSEKNDGAGATNLIEFNGPYALAPYNSTCSKAPSYKLDSIKLFNKHDRFINGANAIPIKTTFFVYTDSLCRGIPNSIDGNPSAGKLTLSKIYFRYGNSDKSLMSPYQFAYGYNPDYNFAAKDRWGTYKPDGGLGNFEFPFVKQTDSYNDLYASAWSLTKITLPSGGSIEANYEADDYAYVQGKEANEMFMLRGIGNTTNYVSNNILYNNKKSSNLYLYYKRRTNAEFPSVGFENYVKTSDTIYYNCNVKMLKSNEQIKGYALVVDAGICPNNTDYGYVKLDEYDPEGGGKMRMNPITLTAINVGRYNLPQLLYPASDPSADLGTALVGMLSAFGEITSLWKNPMTHFLKKSIAKDVNLERSYIRLKSPGLHKKGGGQRVKSLLFYDSWSKLAGGNEFDATYGKKYDYSTEDIQGRTISSGVASYEPLIGGDENPLRMPVKYDVAEGRRWPPIDPIELYQEEPIGETLFPTGMVGYSSVTVKSIHDLEGRSSQGIDVYEYYTAFDFPVQFESSAIDIYDKVCFHVFSQENIFHAKQGYTLSFNDMHGKPKSIKHYVQSPTGSKRIINGTEYHYSSQGKKLYNLVKCLAYDKDEDALKPVLRQLGVEADLTIDSRARDEKSRRLAFNLNYNVSAFGLAVVPLVFGFGWPVKSITEFRSASVTKMIQQYGILSEIVTYNEGAVIHQTNELFDPETGDVLVTSVKNEFDDKEYTTNIPAYWAYSGMKPAYSNIKYEADIFNTIIDTNHFGTFTQLDPYLMTGDELYVTYPNGTSFTAWYMGSRLIPDPLTGKLLCNGTILPRFPLNTPSWIDGDTLPQIHVMVVRSGGKNMLNLPVETYSSLEYPVDGGYLRVKGSFINMKANTFCDSNTSIIHNFLANPDTINPYATGERGIYRLLSEYAYVTPRNDDINRTAGLFSAYRLFRNPSGYDDRTCDKFPYNYISPSFDDNRWRIIRTVTKWSPFGIELENRDALGNYSTVVTGYNDDLPVAVATNARQGEVIADGFEDFSLLRPIGNLMNFSYSFYTPYFGATPLPVASSVYNMLSTGSLTDLNIVSDYAHTGMSSLLAKNPYGPTANVFSLNVPINFNNYSGVHSKYNSYHDALYSFSFNNEYLPFKLTPGKKFILSFWIKDGNGGTNPTTYSLHPNCGINIDGTLYPFIKKSNIIDGWQQVEVVFPVPATVHTATLQLPVLCYMDDMRMFPSDANIKSFVYHPVNEKLLATLDENNFAKIYEYDQEGNLVRVKKETEKGIMTVSESRSNQPNQ